MTVCAWPCICIECEAVQRQRPAHRYGFMSVHSVVWVCACGCILYLD